MCISIIPGVNDVDWEEYYKKYSPTKNAKNEPKK